MNRDLRTFFYIYLVSLFLVGCNKNPDTLQPSPDMSLVDSLIECYTDSVYTPSKQAISLLENHRKEISDSMAINKLRLEISKFHFFDNNFDRAISLAKRAEKSLYRNIPLDKGDEAIDLHSRACNILAVYLTQTARRDEAIEYLKRAARDAHQIGQEEYIPDIYINLADNYQSLGDYPMASDYYHRALATCDSINCKSSKRYAALSGLAKLYLEISNFAQSENYFEQAEEMDFEKSPQELFFFHNSRGNFYYNTREYPKALDQFFEARKAALLTEQSLNIATADANIGEIYIYLDNFTEARNYLDSAQKLFEESYYSPSTKFYVDGLYASLALKDGDLDTANRLLSNSSVPEDNPQYLYYHNSRLMRYYLAKGDRSKFGKYYDVTERYRDSLRNAKIRNSIAESEVRYQRDTMILRRDIELTHEKLNSDRWKMITLATLMLLMLTLSSTIIYIIYRRRRHEVDYHRQLNTITSLRMETIRNRLSPHYIFNVLNMILPAFSPHKDIQEPLSRLVQVLRGALILGENMATSLANEKLWLDNFIALRLLGHNQPIKVVWNIDKDVDVEQFIPSMAIQIPVSNALKHAFNDSIHPEPIVVVNVAYCRHHSLVIDIRDNGSGFDESKESPNRGTGSGLKILNQTIEVLNANNKHKITVKITNLKKLNPSQSGTSFAVTIPNNYNFDI